MRLSLVNRGPRATPGVRARWHLPAGTSLEPADVPSGWTWDAAERVLSWTGPLTVDAGRDFDLRVQLDAGLPEGATQSAWVELDDGQGLPLLRRVTWRVNAADLSTSTKAGPPADQVLDVGDSARFVVAVVNSGNRPAGRFVVTDTLPAGLSLVPSTVAPAAGTTVDLASVPGSIVWSGNVEPGRTASLTYSARVVTYNGGSLTNVAVLDDGAGQLYSLTAHVFARPHLLLPVALWEREDDP
jgi:uncharacterized repeat protein (TIGR01451 family)